MARVDPERIRNVALLGHSHDGKTSLAEAMLYAAGAVDRLGRPDAGNTTFDFEPEEIKRKISIATAIAHLTWHDAKVNLLDTPGFQDFAGDVYGALRAAEGALLVVGASTGVVVGTELAWQQLRARDLPTLIVVNKMDKENADYWKAVDGFKEFSPRPVSIQAPIGHEASFKGVVDLLTRKAYEFDQQGHAKEVPLPSELAAEVESRRSPLVEAAAETDDALLEKYLESGELSDAEVMTALAKGVAAGTIVPVLCAAAGKSIGIGTLLDAIVTLLPSPRQAPPVQAQNPRTEQVENLTGDPAGPLSAIVFKTTADPFVGRISYVKVVSGVLTPGTPLLNAAKDQPERAGTIGFPKGKALEPATEVVAGDIAGISKLQVTATGDTLASRDHPLQLPPIEYPEQTYSAAVGAKNKADEEKVNAALVKLVDEDPTLTLEHEPITKESIVHGMGDIHLDVVLEKMKRKYGVEGTLSVPLARLALARHNTRLDSGQRAAMAAAGRRMTDPAGDTRQACRDYWAIGLRPRLSEPDRTLPLLKSDLCATDPAGLRYGNRIGNRVIMGSYGDWDLRPRLRTLDVPTLVVHGEEESIPMDLVEEWVTSMPRARLLRVPRAAHFTYAERPELVWPAVERFLAGLDDK